MLRSQGYLLLKPSLVGAAALVLAINLRNCDLAAHYGLKKQPDLSLKTLFCDHLMNIEMDVVHKTPIKKANPLEMWNKLVRSTTKL